MATDILSNSLDSTRFFPIEDGDPAIPADPWTHIRYQYGQLLGAEDFTAEQRAFLLRHRLHLALLHGMGTVWGLKVDKASKGTPPQSLLYVDAGLAVDAFGREIYVDQRQCLDVTSLHHNTDFWESLAPSPVELEGAEALGEELEPALPAGEAPVPSSDAERPGVIRPIPMEAEALTEAGNLKRAYVVLSYEACMSDPTPAITPPCGDPSDAFTYSRVTDRFRIDLTGNAPEVQPFMPPWLEPLADKENTQPWRTLRNRLLDHTLDADRSLSHLWQRYEKAPVLLAAVDLFVDGEQKNVTSVFQVDNSVRALLPPMQLIAEQLFGQALSCQDYREPLKVLSVEMAKVDENDMLLTATLTNPVLKKTVTEQSVKVAVIDSTGEWKVVKHSNTSVDDNVINLTLSGNGWGENTIYQVILKGAGERPIVTEDGRPLAGWWDEPVPADGRGRDVSIVRVWKE